MSSGSDHGSQLVTNQTGAKYVSQVSRRGGNACHVPACLARVICPERPGGPWPDSKASHMQLGNITIREDAIDYMSIVMVIGGACRKTGTSLVFRPDDTHPVKGLVNRPRVI